MNKRQQRADLYAQLAAELGGDLSVSERTLLDHATRLLTLNPKHAADKIKAISEGRRILERLKAARPPQAERERSIPSYVADVMGGNHG